MANPITTNIKIGTIGELFVQLKLLELDIQASPPLKDSGNDLIAIKNRTVRFIQIKSTTKALHRKQNLQNRIFDLLAIVHLKTSEAGINYNDSEVYLIPKNDALNIRLNKNTLAPYKISHDLITKYFNT